MKKNLLTLVLMTLAAAVCSAVTVKPDNTSKGYYVAAYIWPSCHDDALAHKYLWEEGIGEWEVIKQGTPRFEGHYQPRQPLWGYEMDDDPKVVERWIDTALEHGVNTFIYDWYWYKTTDGTYNGPYLESALDEGFLKARNNRKMNFFIMWANHEVIHNYWNWHKWGDDTSLLFDPKIGWAEFKVIVDRIINQYFKQPNYLKIDGCPVMAIFSPDLFIRGFGSLQEASKAMAYFRDEAVKAGFKGIYLQPTAGGGYTIKDDATLKKLTEIDKALGVNAHAFYNMGGFNCDYLAHGAKAVEIREQWDELFDIPVYPCVSIGWDDTPRYPLKGAKDVTRFHNTPASFAAFLQLAKEYADAHPEQPKLITINAWNEWVEGSYLLPDKLNGYGYLEAVRDVILYGKYDKK